MSSLENLLINPLWLTVILMIIVGIVGGCIIISSRCGKAIKKEHYRKLDLVFLIFSTLGLFGIVGDNRKFFCEREMEKINHRINTYEWRMNWELDTTIYTHTFITFLHSQEEIDLVQHDFNTMCSWIVLNKYTFLEFIKEKQRIDTLSCVFPIFTTERGVHFQHKIDELKHIISEYNTTVDEYNYYRDLENDKWIEIFCQLFSPLFLVFSLAYQFIKWIEERYTSNQKKCNE